MVSYDTGCPHAAKEKERKVYGDSKKSGLFVFCYIFPRISVLKYSSLLTKSVHRCNTIRLLQG